MKCGQAIVRYDNVKRYYLDFRCERDRGMSGERPYEDFSG
jgi:hypothetical protein